MKKTLALVLMMTLLFSLAACSSGSGSKSSEQGSKETVVSEQSKEDDKTEAVDGATSEDSTTSPEGIAEFKDFIKDYVDLTHYEVGSPLLPNVFISLKDDYKPDYQTKKDVSLVNDIKVVYEDDIEIKKGTKYQEFLDKGWEPKGYLDYASLEKNYIYSDIGLYKNDKHLQISLMTEKEEKTPIKDCVVASLTEFSCEYNVHDLFLDFSKQDPSSPDYMINGKISKTSGLKDIISVFGEPSSVTKSTQKNGSESLLIRYDDTNNGELEFSVSPDGKVIGRFTINWYVQFKR